MVGGIAREHIGQAWLHADTDEGEPPGRAPLVLDRELLVAELDTGERVRLLGMALRQAHRHVEVVGAAGQCPVEDRHDEPRVDGVHDVGDPVSPNEFGDCVGRCGVDLRRGKPRVADGVGGLLGAGLVVVADDELIEEVSPRRNGAERRSDATGAHQEDSHC